MSRGLLVRLVITVFSIASSATLLRQEISRYGHHIRASAGIPNLDWKDLRREIPDDETLGFITDRTQSESIDRALYAASYNLAPIVVEKTVNRRVLLGDFRDSSNVSTMLRRYRLRVVRDFGEGFVLLEHR